MVVIKGLAWAVLAKAMTPQEAVSRLETKEDVEEFEALLKAINKKTGDGRYGRPNPDVDVKEVLKTDKQGQWKIEKAIKPGPAIDYSKFNKKPDYAEIEAKAPTINYGNNKPGIKPTWTGASDKAAAVRTKLDAESKESASETIARRQKMNKAEGANSEPELAADKQKRMVVKNEMMGYGPQDQAAGTMAQSEKEPHKDDPDHEKKEKDKAAKIKKEAESILDMHKAEGAVAGMVTPLATMVGVKVSGAKKKKDKWLYEGEKTLRGE